MSITNAKHAMAQYSEINSVLDRSQKDLRTMKSNHLDVFTVSVQCTEEVKVVSRGILRYGISVTRKMWRLEVPNCEA